MKGKNSIPLWANRLIDFLVSGSQNETIKGDIIESFEDQSSHNSFWSPAVLFLEILSLVKLPILKRNQLNSNMMIRNYFIAAIRNIKRNKLISSINIIGLAMAMAVCFTILLYIINEINYDRYHKNIDRIYRITYSSTQNGNFRWLASSHYPVAQKLKSFFSEIEYTTRIHQLYGGVNITHNEVVFTEHNYVLADEEFFKIFDFEFVLGDQKSPFSNGKGVVITEKAALKYFGDKNPLGKQLLIAHRDYKSELFEVTAVIKDYRNSSHLDFEVIGPMDAYEDVWQNFGVADNYTWTNVWTYVSLKQETNPEDIRNGLISFVKDHYPAPPRSYEGSTLHLQPVKEIHLHSNLAGEIKANGDINHVYIFSFVAFIILIIACANYANLSTAKYFKRANEIGVKKVFGAKRHWLMIQFFSESVFQSLVALVLGFLLIFFTLPIINSFISTDITFTDFLKPELILVYFTIAIFTGLISGFYPALFLSSLKSIQIFKKGYHGGNKTLNLRRIMVVFQFFMTITILISVLVIKDQNDYILTKDLGFDKEHVIVLKGQQIKDHIDVFKDDLLKVPEIQYVSAITSGIPGLPVDTWRFKTNENSSEIPVSFSWVGYDFIKVMGIKLLEGREFDPAWQDKANNSVIINESAARVFGIEKNPEGQEIYQRQFNGQFGVRRVIGLIADYNFESVHAKIKPLVLTLGGRFAIVKFQSTNLTRTLSTIKSTWKKYNDEPLDYYFLDENWAFQHSKESNLNQLLKFFFIIAMVIACMGLFGISIFSIALRTKEMGIRKVLGASNKMITWIFSKEFIKLIIISFLLSIPLSYYIMIRWLENFAYQTGISSGSFIIAAGIVISITILTISMQAIKASQNNPANSLKYQE